MQSKNPIFRDIEKQPGFAYNEGVNAYQQAAAGTATLDQQTQPTVGAPTAGRPMTIDDVIMKTGLAFVALLVGAGIGWVLTPSMPWLPFVAMIVGLVIFFVGAFRKLPKAGTVLSYSLVEGVFLGGISMFYQDFVAASGSDANIITQAVIGTFVAFGVMLLLYRTRIIKVNGTFMKIMMVALVSYLVIAFISFIAALFGVGGGWGFYGVGGLGLLLCVAGVALAAFSLNLDFAAIEQGINEGLPEAYSWRMVFGLVVTLVWLYLEILRFLAILNSNN
ncbi:MAG: Bax inhibitor-1/YccA family protein [Actinobacteria bacterium]|nr:Bax inhibitor-1/YccA family protein [Actinomycetota bacterium]MCB9414206.1 Bax inhibitor-1/YccA family protein [Actinomycetota bacterium]HRY09541.1 Bax inhibitor-1/YccA family protein [Candidatus Nanopelagicales bacterium]